MSQFFNTEAIIDWAKFEDDKFRATFYITNEDFERLKPIFSEFKKQHKGYNKVSLQSFEKRLESSESLKHTVEILSDDYAASFSAGSKVEYIASTDVYMEELDLKSYQSGDKVYVKGQLNAYKSDGSKGINVYLKKITLLEKSVFDLIKDDVEYTDALAKYRDKYKDLETKKVEETEVSINEEVQWHD
jgi:lysyl-tRNA synthetase class II